jgi:outer membrane protein TolC
VTVAANALRSDLNVRLGASLLTPPDARNPVDFANDYSRYQVGFEFDGPLNRQAERNQYRASLITYQRARRDYMALSDQVELQVRTGLRSLRQLRVNFEIARQQLLVAARQLAIERRLLTAPITAQAVGRDDNAAVLRILNAQQQLLNARNDLAASFFGYEQQRVRLLINLEALLLDPRGFPCNDAPLVYDRESGRGPDAGPDRVGQPAAAGPARPTPPPPGP